MTGSHITLSNNAVGAANALDNAISAYGTAKAAADAAVSVQLAAKASLDAAWLDFKDKEGAFSAALLTPPVGYTPPA